MNAENADLKDFSQRKSAFISVLQRFWLLRIKSISSESLSIQKEKI